MLVLGTYIWILRYQNRKTVLLLLKNEVANGWVIVDRISSVLELVCLVRYHEPDRTTEESR